MKLSTVYAVILEGIKPLQLVVQGSQAAEYKFEPLPVILQSLQWLFQKTIKGLEGEINGKHKHRVFPSLLQSLRAATGSLEEVMLPLL